MVYQFLTTSYFCASESPLGPLSTTVTHRACHRMSVIRHSDFYLHFGSSHITWKPRFIKQEDCILNTFKIFMFGNNLHPIISSFIYGNDPIVAAGSRVLGTQSWRCRRLEFQLYQSNCLLFQTRIYF